MTIKNYRIDLKSALRLNNRYTAWVGHNKVSIYYRGELIGESEIPLCFAARWLLDKGLANKKDIITSYRDNKPCMLSNIGIAATQTITETPKIGPVYVKYKPFPDTVISNDDSAANKHKSL